MPAEVATFNGSSVLIAGVITIITTTWATWGYTNSAGPPMLLGYNHPVTNEGLRNEGSEKAAVVE